VTESGGLVRGTARVEVPARLIDLSLGGALLAIATPLIPGAIHDFALDLEGDSVWVQAEVRHCKPSDRGYFHVGVEFVGIDPQDERRLGEYLGQRVRIP
jgi:c-di-GMP-binding flagellar brake protein YcgR